MTDLTRYEQPEQGPARTDLLVPATDSWVASVAEVVKLAGYIAGTPFVPEQLRGSAPATAATILYGREIGVPPMTALQMLHVVKGRVGMAAELMRARVLAQGHDLEVVESTTALCRMRGRRRGGDTWTTVTWNTADARTAGLGGDGWSKYPRQMLLARCSAELCRAVFPDVTHGMVATEEYQDETPAAPTSGRGATRAKKVARAQAAPPQEVTWQAPSPPSPPTPPAEPEAQGPPVPTWQPEPEQPQEVEPEQGQDPEPEPEQPKGDAPATQAQARHVMALLDDLDVGQTREDRLHITQALLQRRVTSFSQCTITDLSRVITILAFAKESTDPQEYVRWLVEEGHATLAAADPEPEQGEE